MDINTRIEIARAIQDRCTLHKIDCEVKTTFTTLGQTDNNDMIPYVSIWVYPKDRSKCSFSVYLWNDVEDYKNNSSYQKFITELEELIKECK
jgi:hypothetical protein